MSPGKAFKGKVIEPTPGRIVLVGTGFKSSPGGAVLVASVAIILEVAADLVVTVNVLDPRVKGLQEKLPYGVETIGCWWYPPTVTRTAEVPR